MSDFMKVSEIMSPNPYRISPNTPINEIRSIFKKVHFWSVYVVKGNELVGIITRNDLKFRAQIHPNGTASDIMSPNVYQIDLNADVKDAESLLNATRVSSLAVVKNRKLCGIITRYDIRTRYYPNLRARASAGDTMAGNTSDMESDYTPYKENVGFWDRIFHNTDPVYWKKTIKKELDHRWNAFNSSIEQLIQDYESFKKYHMEIIEEEANLEVIKEEWDESLKSLGNLLNKHTQHEKQMWDTTQKSSRTKDIKIKQKFKDSDVDEIRFNNMMDYIKQYPELQSKSTISHLLEDVNTKRNEVVDAAKRYRSKIKEANVYLNTVKMKLEKVEGELESFEKMKKEGEDKVNNINTKSVFGKIKKALDTITFKTEAEKQSVLLNFYEYDRKIETSKRQLKLIKNDLAEYERREFKPIVTQKFKDIE